ncbi:MAG TPA: MFS transporter [Candidatus Dormibacteraeota bacterium]|nr:MFS transporter [Candidatus Dormibacteraeota bacterium]
MIRSRSGALIAALTGATLATGLLQISLPLELRQLRASPNEIGLALSMYGFGMFAFEWIWGVLADRVGYGAPLVVSQLLYAASIVLLARVDSIVLIAASYFLASGMMVAVGPIARSYVGTALQSRLRATGLALLSASWVVAEAVGAGAGGQLIDHFPIRGVMLAAAVLPVGSALLAAWVFRGYSRAEHHGAWTADDEARSEESRAGGGVLRILAVTASLVLLIQVGAGGELALLPLLVTTHLHLSAASAGTAMLAVGLIGGVLLIPGGNASDRWGRRPTMIAGGILSAVGFIIYSTSGTFVQVIAGAAVRALGASLIWPAATAWMAESMPRRRHAFYMGLFGEFENVGITIGPILGGLAWSIAGIQAAFYTYAAAALLASFIAAVFVRRRVEDAIMSNRMGQGVRD